MNLFFPINRRPGLYKRLKTTKTKQAGNSHNPIEPDKILKANWSTRRFLEKDSINMKIYLFLEEFGTQP